MATRALQVLITGDSTSLRRSLGTVDDTVDRSEKRIKRFGGAAAAAMKGVGLAAAAVGAVGLKQAATAAIEAEKSNARMTTQLKAAGIGFRAHAGEIDRVIQKTSQLAGLDDEDLQDAFTNIVRVTGDVNKSLKLTGLAADFARAKHMDVARAGEIVGKVAGGNTGILSRYGISIDKGATSTEALGKLQEKFAGQAEAYGKTTAGSVERASVAWENLLEVLGAKLAPVIQKAADLIGNLFDRTSKGNKIIRDLGQAYVTYLGWIRDAIKVGIAWVKRFADRNREDINEVVRAFRNLARFARNVFEDVLVPVIRRVLPVIRGVAEGIATALRGMIRIVTGLINGDWRRAWEGVKDIARGAVRALKSILKGLWEAFKDALAALVPLVFQAAKASGRAVINGIIAGAKAAPRVAGRIFEAYKAGVTGLGRLIYNAAIGWGKAIINGMVAGIKAAPGKVKDAITGALGGIGGAITDVVGEGVGKIRAAVPRGSASLQGASTALAPLAAIGSRLGLSVTSGKFGRENKLTSTGKVSYHSSGEAIDVGGPAPAMLSYFRTLKKNFGPQLAELIHTPGGAGIWNGSPHVYTGKTAAEHYDHVHVAVDLGPAGPGVGGPRGPTGDGTGRGDGLGKFSSTAYGPPWNAMNGTGVTATGVDLRPARQAFGIAVDPNRLRLGRSYYVWPNPFARRGPFKAFDTGGAIKGNRLDFYDWRGRSTQMGWGRRDVTVSTTALAGGGGGGGGGTSGGGTSGSGGGAAPKKAGPGDRFSYTGAGGFTVAREQGQVSMGTAPGSAVGLDPGIPVSGGRVTGYGIDVSRAQRTQAVARQRNNLAMLIKGLVTEIRLKRRKIKRIRKLLKGRLKPANRKKWIEEETQLVGEIADLAATIKEYRADAAGGATTVTGAEALDAGVAADTGAGGDAGTGAEAEPGPTREDYLFAQLAEAGITPGVDDDRAALAAILGLREEELVAARASGDPRRIREAIEAWKSATEALNGVDDSAQRLADAMAGLKDEMKRQNDIYETVVGVSSREAVKAMADIVSGQIVGVGLQGRRQTAGTGATVLIP